MTEPRPYLTERRPCTWCEEIAAFAILWDLYEPPDYACAFHAGRWERAGLRFPAATPPNPQRPVVSGHRPDHRPKEAAMSYPRDLDEYTDHDLIGSLHQRATDRARGLCDYCHQPSASTAPCRFAIRHALAGFDVSHNGAASGQADPTDTEEAVPK